MNPNRPNPDPEIQDGDLVRTPDGHTGILRGRDVFVLGCSRYKSTSPHGSDLIFLARPSRVLQVGEKVTLRGDGACGRAVDGLAGKVLEVFEVDLKDPLCSYNLEENTWTSWDQIEELWNTRITGSVTPSDAETAVAPGDEDQWRFFARPRYLYEESYPQCPECGTPTRYLRGYDWCPACAAFAHETPGARKKFPALNPLVTRPSGRCYLCGRRVGERHHGGCPDAALGIVVYEDALPPPVLPAVEVLPEPLPPGLLAFSEDRVLEWPRDRDRVLALAQGVPHTLLMGMANCMFVARKMAERVAPMEADVAQVVRSIHATAGSLAGKLALLRGRPFRAPHFTASPVSLFGYLQTPGEVSLAHEGVLFLDDVASFGPAVLWDLVQVMIHQQSHGFPAAFQLIAAEQPANVRALPDELKMHFDLVVRVFSMS